MRISNHILASIVFIIVIWPFNLLLAADHLELQKVTENVYAIIGSLNNRTPKNLGNNATFGFVVTSEGVVLIDSGGTYKGAEKLYEMIRRVTDKPVVKVINTGGQDHRWMGNGYFKKLGAEIITNLKAVEDQRERSRDQFIMLGNLVGNNEVEATIAVYADKTFKEEMHFVLGGIKFELHHAGQAHTPGDSFVWLPGQKVMFTGDIVYTERMLGILDYSNSKSWVKVYQEMAAYNPQYVIPGHGHPTNLAKANSDTYHYLTFLRQSVADFIENGGVISETNNINQSKFKYLLNYELLSGRNAQQVYSEIEWE